MNTPTTKQTSTKEQRRPTRGKSFSFLKGRIAGSDAFLAEKHAETARELAKETATRSTILSSLE